MALHTSEFISLYQRVVFLVAKKTELPKTCAIITACNPRGEVVSTERNSKLNQQLRAAIEPFQYRTIVGCSLDLSHREPSFAVNCPQAKALELARQFKQNAIYWLENGELYLLPVLLAFEPRSLGSVRNFIKAEDTPQRVPSDNSHLHPS